MITIKQLAFSLAFAVVSVAVAEYVLWVWYGSS
jgi:hypothetical protein